jgi:uncharacterized protein
VTRVTGGDVTGPPLWCVERPGSRVFLFGETVGLRPAHEWLRPAVRHAVEASRVLWREADRDELSSSPLLATYALSDEPLSGRLGPETLGQVGRAARGVGVDPDTLEGLRPWVAAQVLEGALRATAGLDGRLGVDSVIAGLAAAAGTPARSELGDAAATFGWFDGLGPKLEVDYLLWTVERLALGAGEMERQVRAWLAGDPTVTEEQNDAMRRDHPGLHERLLIERNRAWVARIDAMLAEPGTAFVLVGGAHLAGGGSILDLLADAGLPVALSP